MRVIFILLFHFVFFCAAAQIDYEFVANKGQFHENVLYKANIPSGALFLEKNGLTFSFYEGGKFHDMHHGEKIDKIRCHAYKVEFVGANHNPGTSLSRLNSGAINFYLGNDTSKWVSGLKGGREVYYKNIYDDIDFKIYTKNGQLKYDFIVHPGADPSQIVMVYTGLDELIKKGEDLLLSTSLGIISDSRPLAIQNNDIIKASFIKRGNRVGFKLGDYNKNQELIIDPTLIFSTYSGSFANNFGFTATYDDQGNLYAGGSVFDQGYPFTLGAFDVTFNSSSTRDCGSVNCWGISDIAITKYSSDGRTRLYSTYLGGNRCEVPHSLIVNNRNELFVLGTTSSDNYPVTFNAFDQTFNGGDTVNLANGIYVNYTYGSDIVISRLSSDGSSMLASTYVGGTENDGLNLNSDLVANYADQMRGEIILDEFQNVVVGSSSASLDFPTTSGALQTSYGGGEQDGVVFKMDENLSGMIWSSYLGGNDADGIYSVIQSNSNDVYAAGGTKSQNIPFSSNAFQSNYQGGFTDGFYAKLSNGGDVMLKGSYLGSDQYDQVYFIREDSRNRIYFYGQSNKFGSYWISDAAYNIPNSGQFILKLDSLQNTIEWSTTFGSGDNKINISPTAFMVDLCDRIYLSGWGSNSSGFDGIGGNIADGTTGMEVTSDAFKSSTLGHDFYLMVLESDASSLVYGSFYGGDLSSEHVDGGTSRFDKKGVMYQSVCAGCGGYSDFPIEPFDAVSPTNNANCNNGVFKFDFGLPYIVADFEIPPVSCSPATILFTNTSKILNSTSFLWDFGDGTFSTDTNPSHFYNNPGNYEVVLKIMDSTACNFEDSISMDIVLMGGELEEQLNNYACAGVNLQIGIPPYAETSVTYNWSPSSGLSDSSVANPIANIDSSRQYQLIVSGNTCSDTIYQNIIISQFDLKAFGDTSICNPVGVVAVHNESNSGLIHHWSMSNSFNDTLVYGIDSNEVFVELDSGENYYYIKVEDSIGCEAFDSVFIVAHEYDINYENNLSICLNDSVEVIPFGYENYDSVFFSWGPSPLLLSSSNDTNAVLYGLNTGEFTVPVTSSSAHGCTDTDYVNITFKYSDTEIKTSGDTIVCNSTPMVTLVDESDGNLIHHWSSNNEFSDTLLYGLNERQITLQSTSGENYVYIKITDSANCFAFDSVFIGVYEYNVDYENDLSICLNDSIEIVPVGYENYDSVFFSWGPSPLLLSSSNDTNAVLYGLNIGEFTVPVTSSSAHGCTDTDYVNITFKYSDIEIKTSGDTTVCNSTPMVTLVDESDGNLIHHWSSNNEFSDTLLYGLNENQITLQSTLGENYVYIKITDSANCFAFDSVFIGVYEYNVDYENDLSICLNDSIEVVPIGYENYDSVFFSWGPSPLLLSSSNDTNAVLYGLNIGEFTVPVKSSSALGCTDTDYVSVTIKYSDTEIKTSGDTIVCNSTPMVTFVDESDGNLIHHWSSNNEFSDTLLFGLNENQITLQSTLGENYIYIKITDSVNCFAFDSVFIGVYEYNVNYENDLSICLNDSIEVAPIGYENYDSVFFSWGPSPLLLSSSNDTNAVFHGFVPGTYSVPVTSTSAYSCTDTDYVDITIANFDTSSIISVTTNFDTLINNQTAILTVLPDGLSYDWNPNGSVLNIYDNKAEVVIEESTLFTVEINDPQVNHCFRRDSVYIVFIDSKCEEPYIYVPNAFSPNGDGENDVLFVRGNNITDLYFAVFNRWGEKVFETNDQSKGWDGYYNNRSSDPAVFDYYLKYECEGGRKHFQKGNVTLIR